MLDLNELLASAIKLARRLGVNFSLTYHTGYNCWCAIFCGFVDSFPYFIEINGAAPEAAIIGLIEQVKDVQ
jgi:hypothetical protein